MNPKQIVRLASVTFALLLSGGAFAQNTGTLAGRVLDAVSGQPIQAALVSVAGGAFQHTDAAGDYSFAQQPWNPRTYVVATAPGYRPEYRAYAMQVGQTTVRDFDLQPMAMPRLDVTTYPAAGGTVTLTVQGDPGSPVLLVLSNRASVPPIDLTALGVGHVWVAPGRGLLDADLGVVPATGVFTIDLPAPGAPGWVGHLQCIVLEGGAWRLSNGAAVETR